MTSTARALLVLVGVLVLVALGPYFTTLAVNQLAGREILKFTFYTWLAIVWINLSVLGGFSRMFSKKDD